MADRNRLKTDIRRYDTAIKRLEAKKRERRGGGDTSKSALSRQTPNRTDILGSPFGVPYTRKGEDSLTSRGYEFSRLAALAAGMIGPEHCQVELAVARHLDDAMRKCPGFKPTRKSIIAPLSPGLMMGHGDHAVLSTSVGGEISKKMWETTAKFDPQEAEWLSRKFGVPNTTKDWTPDTQKVGGSNQSWLQQNLGGAVVPFPEMGPLIPLLRNKNALMTAGAQVIPLPPSGRIAFPRQTGPTTTYHVGEGNKITQSNVTTDQFTLSAKKIGAYIITNNELIRYGGPIVEQMFRNDMTISLGLQLDFDCLQGEGSDNVVAGLIGYPGVTTFTPTTVATNGNTLAPQDIYTFIGQIRANNANFEGWIIRPELLYAMVGKRASVLASGDNLGLFLFDILRGFNKRTQSESYFLGGAEVTDSANVPANRVKGNASNLTALYGGMWSDYRIGIYGTIEIATADQGDNIFPQDQTAIRAILSADGGPWHPGAFGVADTLLLSTIGA